MYTVINVRTENKKRIKSWLKFTRLEEAKAEEAKHQTDDDYSKILVPYDEYLTVVNKLKTIKAELDCIKRISETSAGAIFKYIDEEVINDTL